MKSGFDLSGCPGGIHALKFVRPTQDWLSFIIWDRPKTDQKIFLKSIPDEMIGDSREFFTYLLGESRLIEILFTNELSPSDKCECKLSFDQVTNV